MIRNYKISTATITLATSTAIFLTGFLLGYNCIFDYYNSIKIYINLDYNIELYNIFINNINIIIINILGEFVFSTVTILCLLYNDIILGYETRLALV